MAVVWAIAALAALAMVMPYWLGGYTWGIRYGRGVVIVVVLLALTAVRVFRRRLGADGEAERHFNELRSRDKAVTVLVGVLGLVPSVLLVVAVAAAAGLAQ